MKDKILIIFSAIIIVLVLVCGSIFLFGSAFSDGRYAYIYSEGELIEVIDLSESAQREITVQTDNGYNTVKISGGKICVCEADCPDKTCINTGYTDNPLVPVICMPHRLEIVIKSSDVELDGVSR